VGIRVRSVEPADRASVDPFLRDWYSDVVARRGELVDARRQSGLLAEDDVDRRLLGVLTYLADGADWEILTLHAAESWRGIGSALLAAVESLARGAGARRLHLVTTNDNVDAIRFYQRRGFRIATVHAGAVDESRRTLKPWIPETGEYGIPIRDELVFEKLVET
jgi:GNAT superfamily N-acetyltransferase